MPSESVTLYFREGSSDKIYQAQIEEEGGGCVVNFQYGRRGSALQAGSKTPSPVPYDKAKKIFDKLVGEKTAKGYKPDAAGAAYVNASREERDTGLRPQLLNPIDEDEVERYILDKNFVAQEKWDGRRCLVIKRGPEVVGTNRKGLSVGLPKSIVDEVAALDCDVILDGELMGDRLVAFDALPSENSLLSLEDRLKLLDGLPLGVAVEKVQTATTVVAKRTLYERMKRNNREGIVFKRRTATYKPGRPDSGGDQLKFKFYATASCIVTEGRAGKRSVGLLMVDGCPGGASERGVNVGNVTVPANQPIPKAGQVVEVRYLYAYPGGSLYQPILLGTRDDVGPEACVVTQLKYKATDSDEE